MSEASDADVVNQAITEESVPQIAPQNPTKVKLLRGIREEKDDGEVVWHDEATVRELTGADEEALASIERKDILYAEYLSAMLSRAVENIGGLKAPSDAVLNKLIIADREMLMLGILRLTYGDTRELHTTCPECNTLNTITIDLTEDFPIKEPDFDIRKGVEVTVRKKHYTMRLPNAEDTIEAQRNSKTDPEYNTIVLSRCLTLPEGTTDALAYARNLSVADRHKLIDVLLDAEVGPTLEGVDTQCAECGINMPILLDWVSLLLG